MYALPFLDFPRYVRRLQVSLEAVVYPIMSYYRAMAFGRFTGYSKILKGPHAHRIGHEAVAELVAERGIRSAGMRNEFISSSWRNRVTPLFTRRGTPNNGYVKIFCDNPSPRASDWAGGAVIPTDKKGIRCRASRRAQRGVHPCQNLLR